MIDLDYCGTVTQIVLGQRSPREKEYFFHSKHVYVHRSMSHRPVNTTRVDADDKEQKIDRQDSNHCRRPIEDLEHPQRDE